MFRNNQGSIAPTVETRRYYSHFRKGQNPDIDSYSTFFDNGRRAKTSLDGWLQQHSIDHLYVMGLATDYCVKYSVLDALALGYRTTVISDGCRG